MENTTTPNTPQELMNLQKKEPLTPAKLLEAFLELTYEEQDNFIYKLLKGQHKFHQFLLQKSLEGDKSLPNTEQLYKDVTRLELCCELYLEVE